MSSFNFKELPTDVMKYIQNNSGLVLSTFDPDTFDGSEDDITAMRANILCATDGGINIVATPTYRDNADGLDNAATNTKELKVLDSWAVNVSFTAKSVSSALLKTMLGAADSKTAVATSGRSVTTVSPRDDLDTDTDFTDYWFVFDYGVNGGFIAVKLQNGLNQDGFNLQSSNNEKGAFTVNLVGHGTMADLADVPMKFYVNEEDVA